MRREGIPEADVQREVAAWRRSGWEPQGEFTRAMLSAFAARNSGAPDSIVSAMVAPWAHRYGAGAVGEAFEAMSAAKGRMEARRT